MLAQPVPVSAGKALLVTAFDAGTSNSNSIPSLIKEYRKCSSELGSLKESNAVENAQTAQKRLKALQKKEATLVRQLEQMRANASKERHRVERQVKKPSLFGHGGGLIFENKDKTARLKAELSELDEMIHKTNKELDDVQEKIKQARVEADDAMNVLNREKELKTKMESLIDQVVRLTPDYAQLSSLRADSLELESLRKKMGAILLSCETAMKDYQRSLQLTRKARNSNLFSAVNQRNERLWQLRRDRMMTQSTQPAEAASANLVETFKHIPQEARIKYPSLMQGVGSVPLAKLSVGKFGKTVLVGAAFGNVGDAMNKINQMRKIKENEQQIQICIQVVKEQIILLTAVNNQMDKDVQEILSKMSRLRKSVFERESNGGSASSDLLLFGVSETPSSYPAVKTATATATATARVARTPAVASAVPAMPTVSQSGKLILTMDHKVDELSPVMLQHNIISLSAGDVVDLVRGTLEGGLGGVYSDYIEVRDKYGKTGKISCKVVKPAPANIAMEAPPPPAIF
uniref:Uncharacterized protein n=1 Tax=Aplanochytrium stocchinoi TaxID=215587 RepID=A0A7S3PJB8_9STRA